MDAAGGYVLSMVMKSLVLIALLATMGTSYSVYAEDLAIIVSKSSSLENLTRTELRNIFLQQTRKDQSGIPFQVFMREKGSTERKCALLSIYHLNEAGLDAYFLRMLYVGESQSVPRVVPSSSVMKHVVAKTPGAIGYISVTDADDSVKVLKINNILPGADGYPLQLPDG